MPPTHEDNPDGVPDPTDPEQLELIERLEGHLSFDRAWARITGSFPRELPLRVLRDAAGVVHANVPPVVVHHSGPGAGYEIGEGADASPKGLDFALNILTVYVPPSSDGLSPVRCQRNVASATAFALHEEFARDFLSALPENGPPGDVPNSEIYAWISARAPHLRPLLYPRP